MIALDEKGESLLGDFADAQARRIQIGFSVVAREADAREHEQALHAEKHAACCLAEHLLKLSRWTS